MRPLRSVPPAVCLLLASALGLQLLVAQPCPKAQPLAPAPSLAALQLASIGDPLALSKALLLDVQGADDQDGLSVSWRTLDYTALRGWLGRVLDLDPRAQAPLLAASQVYGAVEDPRRVRIMLDFVYQRFAEDPDRRWPWLAHAAIVARHRLHDLPLARRYAEAIRTRATGPDVPPWARQLELFILDDMNEFDSARALAGALLQSGQIRDPRELAWLARRLDSLQARPR